MKVSELTLTTTTSAATAHSTATRWFPVNHHSPDFQIGFGISKTGAGTGTYKVQHTFVDLIAGGSAGAADIFDHSVVSAAAAGAGNVAVADGNYAFPIAALRLAMVTAGGASVGILRIIQNGS